MGGVPEIQRELLPTLRGSMSDSCTAEQIHQLLGELSVGADVREKEASITVARFDVPAYLDLAEIVANSEDGIKIMSFCVEADHRHASSEIVQHTRDAFL